MSLISNKMCNCLHQHLPQICLLWKRTGTLSGKRCCVCMYVCYMIALIIVLPPFGMGFELEFCDSNVIDHFGCDAAPILKITCSDTEFLERFVLVLAALMLLFTLVCVIMSYTYIIRTILRFPSAHFSVSSYLSNTISLQNKRAFN